MRMRGSGRKGRKMGTIASQKVMDTIAVNFQTEGEITELIPFGNGYINDTFRITCGLPDGGEKKYILQKMNVSIFKNPAQLMENVMNVTSFLRKKIIAAGGDPDRETLNVIQTKDGANYLEADGEYWRMYIFIEGATCYDEVKTPEDFYKTALSFGNFQKMLEDYPADTLHETIVNFHNAVSRFADFKKAVEEDVCGRAKEVQEEIKFIFDREDVAHIICDALEEKRIPLRVTHNDTKLNNIMIDNETGKGLCVIDLDTVMPGSALYDFGDSIRFGASTGAEDEVNLDLVSVDLELFEAYAKGFLEGCGGSLTDEEVRLFPAGAKVITFEQGMRFLTDYLQGDTYYKTSRPGHNLDRARTQLKLVADMEEKWEQMEKIVEKYSAQ